MVNIIGEAIKYVTVILMIVYTFRCFTVFGYTDQHKIKKSYGKQNRIMFAIHFMSFVVLYLHTKELKVALFYVVQATLLIAVVFLYKIIYPKVSRMVVNNMCMLLSIGFIMITRLSYDKAVKQFIIATAAVAVSLVVPVIIRKVKSLSNYKMFYAGAGLVALAAVIVAGRVSGGAKLGFTIAGFGIQPSEFVKIIFVFFVASSFKASIEFKDLVKTTIVAALHVLILVASKDLGAALIIFVVYLVMLYVATRQPLYILGGLAAGSVASVGAYYLFGHVRTRVVVWRDPFASYDSGGYQVAQSLFAIGTGSWFGMGLYQGAPDKIPVADEDFIFSAISEEFGLIFALCLILICISCYVMFLNIAMQLHDGFYKLVALGLGTCYIFQVFLTIGGVTKFIPSTGVTLPLISYGGSSVFSTLIMFAIIQGLYILREDEEEDIERRKARQLQEERRIQSPERAREPVKRRSPQGKSEPVRKKKAPNQEGRQQRVR